MVKKTYVPEGENSGFGNGYMNGTYTDVDETSPDDDTSYIYNSNVLWQGIEQYYCDIYTTFIRNITVYLRSKKTGGSTAKTAGLSMDNSLGATLCSCSRTLSTSYVTVNGSGSDKSLAKARIYFTIFHSSAPVGQSIRTTMMYCDVYFDWKHKVNRYDTRKVKWNRYVMKNIAKINGVE